MEQTGLDTRCPCWIKRKSLLGGGCNVTIKNVTIAGALPLMAMIVQESDSSFGRLSRKSTAKKAFDKPTIKSKPIESNEIVTITRLDWILTFAS